MAQFGGVRPGSPSLMFTGMPGQQQQEVIFVQIDQGPPPQAEPQFIPANRQPAPQAEPQFIPANRQPAPQLAPANRQVGPQFILANQQPGQQVIAVNPQQPTQFVPLNPQPAQSMTFAPQPIQQQQFPMTADQFAPSCGVTLTSPVAVPGMNNNGGPYMYHPSYGQNTYFPQGEEEKPKKKWYDMLGLCTKGEKTE